ncbi:hypothetical protein PCANC_13887 [Puccinia coronata f. sp. avenae]|uniref:Uncharacterized protein n=1 Tax=Puccinia coronata f. sp. avenae TaxID=200324 RepID=A0A2N5SPR7_9BASI|nr:hypothetical protein PCANC_13887 [Puccinia coronata f. sp. avenae]
MKSQSDLGTISGRMHQAVALSRRSHPRLMKRILPCAKQPTHHQHIKGNQVNGSEKVSSSLECVASGQGSIAAKPYLLGYPGLVVSRHPPWPRKEAALLSFNCTGRERSNGPLNTQPSLVFEGFQRLLRSTDQGNYYGTETKPICIDDELSVEEKKELLNRLHSVCLPLLDRQIIQLLELIDPYTDLQEESVSESKLQPILDIQSALQDNIGDIRSALDHLKELKAFRLKGLDQYLRIDLPRSLFEFFNESLQIIEPQSIPGVFPRLFPSPWASLSNASSAGSGSHSLADHASSSRDLIKMTMEWIVGSRVSEYPAALVARGEANHHHPTLQAIE